jgi:hypothetical protein
MAAKTMNRTIHLTDDNWADYFPNDYPESLVKGFKVTRCRGVAGAIRGPA